MPKMDRVPVLALTGQINTQVMGPGAFQEIDLSSAFESVARFSHTVLPGVTTRNSHRSHSRRRSSSVTSRISFCPDEVQTLDAETKVRADRTAVSVRPRSLHHLSRRRMGAAAIACATSGHRCGSWRPPRYLRGGVVGRGAQVPCHHHLQGKGLIREDMTLGAGVLGRSGTPVASWFMNQADLLVVFGASFAHHTGIDKSKPTIQVDFDRMALGKFHGVDEAVWGDIGITARLMREQLPDSRVAADQLSELAERWQAWRDEKATREKQDRGHGLNSALIFKHLAEAVPDDAVISVDVGNNTYSFGRYFETRRQTVLMWAISGRSASRFQQRWGPGPRDPTGRLCQSVGMAGSGSIWGSS